MVAAAVSGAISTHLEKIKDLSYQLGINIEATTSFLRIIGADNVPVDKIPEVLQNKAKDYLLLQAQVKALHPEDEHVKMLIKDAEDALLVGDFQLARHRLSVAASLQLEAAEAAATVRKDAQALERKQRRSAARTIAANAKVCLTLGEYREAADVFSAAVSCVEMYDEDEKYIHLSNQAYALYRCGLDKGDVNSLRDGIRILRAMLEKLSREDLSDEWAYCLAGLGGALTILADFETGTGALLEAVSMYDEALSLLARRGTKRQWAATQNDLGNVLGRLGNREIGTLSYEKAIRAYSQALTVRKRSEDPHNWAIVQANLDPFS